MAASVLGRAHLYIVGDALTETGIRPASVPQEQISDPWPGGRVEAVRFASVPANFLYARQMYVQPSLFNLDCDRK